MHHVDIDGKACRTAADLFKTFAFAFNFPDYFGHNWNALADCLSDLDFEPPSEYLVHISNAEELLISERDVVEQFATLLSVLHNTCENLKVKFVRVRRGIVDRFRFMWFSMLPVKASKSFRSALARLDSK